MTIKVGDKLPNATMFRVGADGIEPFEAREYFDRVLREGNFDQGEYGFSQAFSERMAADPAWPHWLPAASADAVDATANK